ncbi:low-affinity phosphate transporter [Exophiala xenobiotica]|nr:low-affinity phosphate transporter [Exophiala xenobiotica]KAK5321413.1 low-affinity phosphate transporter [Exophiala xenobiotica]KAK5369734.1 low-affinity phosphate transporter [Exophiala xenobiotica]KAK5371767.1 low-affinity phosphate transporter [Exophiala xenobiotica]
MQGIQPRTRPFLDSPNPNFKPAGPSIELESFGSAQAREANRSNKRLRKLEQLAEREEMKFSHSIQFNAVPDWSSNYISYSNLKKAIYSLEKQINKPPGEAQDEENTALLGSGHLDPDTTFKRTLDSELDKVCSFYRLKELEIFGEVEHLLKDAENYQHETNDLDMDEVVDIENRRKMTRSQSIFNVTPFRRKRRASTMSVSMEEPELDDDSDSDAEDHAAMLKKKPSNTKPRSKSAWNTGSDRSDLAESREDLPRPESPTYLRRRPSLAMELEGSEPGVMSALYDSAITLKKRIISIYVSLCELRSFIQLNQTGFKKATKKYDKVCNRDIRKDYLEKVVNPSYPFLETTMAHLEENIGKVEKCYADIITKGDQDLARRELRLHLREHVVWERNTVWREMIGIERKAQAANFGIRQTLLGGVQDPSKARLQGDRDESDTKEIITPVGRYRCPKWLFSSSFFALTAVLGIFLVLLLVPIMKKTEQQNCLAMLIFVSLLWATEVIPLFVTSLLVPFLVVVLRIMRSEDKPYHRLDSKAATKAVFAAMWTPVIMLLLGGFTIAAALSKYHIAKMMATFVLSKAGTKARTVLVTNMFVGMFLSMWISNVAAPVLCFSIIQPILRNLPADSNMSKALILGIALASNIGGMASPIASPQNIVALQNMKPTPSWGVWFFVALPVCIISIVLIWLLLLVSFKPGRGTTIVPIRPMKDKLTGLQYFIIFVTLLTIVLWCTSHQLEGVFGDMGVIAIIPMVLFFGTGILTKEDFNNFLWTIIILAAGGLCLGKAVSSSGLLHTIARGITDGVSGLSIYGVLVVFAALILVVATFISHTVAALIILPLVQQVGAGMDQPHPNLLVMGSALMCSAAMGLPTSGFPNMTAIMMEVPETGVRYLRVKHFLTRGIPASMFSFAVIITVGYGLMLAVGL